MESELELSLTTRINVVGTIKYIGEALPGMATSAPAHRISRLDTTTGDLTAAGTGGFDQVWDKRLTLLYT